MGPDLMRVAGVYHAPGQARTPRTLPARSTFSLLSAVRMPSSSLPLLTWTLALAAGSMDDAAAWCVLAIVLASFSGESSYAVYAIGGGVTYAVVMMTLGRKLLSYLGRVVEREGKMSSGMLTFTLPSA